jgi:PAS domain S-box-containing protein
MEKEALFRVMADTAPVMIWISGPDKLCTFFNKRWLTFTGRPAEAELGTGWVEGVHRDDLERCLATYHESFDRREEFVVEYRLRRHDGEYRWLSDTGAPWFTPDGSFAGYIGSCFDVTDLKLAAEALSGVSARLIEAQEQERTRIARELHDDIGGALAVLGIELLRAGQPVSGSPGRKHPGTSEVYEKMQEIAARVSRLSHQLHPPALEYFGLAEAIRLESREFSDKYRIQVQCSCNEFPAKPDRMVSLSFLRILQEALHNAGRHSRAESVTVNVVAEPDSLSLEVKDDGIGFDPGSSRLAAGLGLISMRERMRLIGGECAIWSQPGQGTKIFCRAPLASPKALQL